MAASILLHLTLLVALQPASAPQEERFSDPVVEVTLERPLAAPAAPAPPAMAEAGQVRPTGSIDLVHTAPAPGPTASTLMLQRPLADSPAEPLFSSAWQPAEAARLNAAMILEQPPIAPKPAAGAASAARAPDTLTGFRRRRRCSLSDRQHTRLPSKIPQPLPSIPAPVRRTGEPAMPPMRACATPSRTT